MRTIVNGLLVREGSVLLAKRSPHWKSYAGLWSFPGGNVEQKETLTEVLVRELREEIGITPTTYTHFSSIKDPNTHRVAGGGHPPPAPTDRSVQISRTTLFKRWFTAQRYRAFAAICSSPVAMAG